MKAVVRAEIDQSCVFCLSLFKFFYYVNVVVYVRYSESLLIRTRKIPIPDGSLIQKRNKICYLNIWCIILKVNSSCRKLKRVH